MATGWLDPTNLAAKPENEDCPPATLQALQSLEAVHLENDLLEWYLGALSGNGRERS